MPYIYLPDLLEAEQDIADRLAMLAKRGKNTARDLDKNIQILELTQGFAYAPLQKEAIRKAMTENCLVLTGGPGTGKTTTVNAILQLLENQAERVALCAPTGRAAKRLSELTGRKASTIHRLLEVDYTGGVVSFIHNDKNLLKCDVVILDEMSMVDVKLFQALIAALRYSCRIIMVGDADQLPSVGPGNILGEVIRSGLVPTVCLNEIFRQANAASLWKTPTTSSPVSRCRRAARPTTSSFWNRTAMRRSGWCAIWSPPGCPAATALTPSGIFRCCAPQSLAPPARRR